MLHSSLRNTPGNVGEINETFIKFKPCIPSKINFS